MQVRINLLIATGIVCLGTGCAPIRAQPPVFDAVSVKVQDPDAPKISQMSGGPGSNDPGRLHIKLNMSALLPAAFGLATDQIKGPAWLRDFAAMPFYEIVATIRPEPRKSSAS